jgi:hypothetical protein
VCEGLLAQGTCADENFAQKTTGVALHLEGLLQLRVGDQIAGEELITQAKILLLGHRVVRRIRPRRTWKRTLCDWRRLNDISPIATIDHRRHATSATALRAKVGNLIVFTFLFERHESPQRFSEKAFSGQ